MFGLLMLILASQGQGTVELTLDDAIHRALSASPRLKKADTERERMEARADSAAIVFVPRIGIKGTYTRISREDLPVFSDGFAFPQFLDNYSLDLSVNVSLSDYLLTLPALYRIAKRGHFAQLAQQQSEREQAILGAAETFLGLLQAREASKVAEVSYTTLDHQAKDLGTLAEAGDVTRADVMAVQAQAASVLRQWTDAKGQARLMQAQLAQQVGLNSQTAIALKFAWEQPPQEIELHNNQAVEKAVAQRPELKALEETLEIQQAEGRQHLSAMLPELTAGGAYRLANPNDRIFPLVNAFRDSWYLFLALSWSPNDFVTERTLWRESDLIETGLRADLEALYDAIELEVVGALNQWQVARDAVTAAKLETEAANIAYRDRKRLFDAGGATVQELLDSELSKRRAELNRIAAAVQWHGARLRYDRALGQLMDRPEGANR